MAKTERRISPGTIFKSPPQSEELEKIILGTCLIEKDAFEIASEIITAETVFYYEKHQQIFAAMKAMFIARRSIDIMTVQEWLKENNQLDKIGGTYYLTTLTDDVVGSAHLEQHCLILLQKHINRNIIISCQDAMSKAMSDEDCFDVANDLIKYIEEVTNKAIGDTSISFSQGVFNFIKRLQERINNQGQLTGVPSGFHRLDQCTNGWQECDLIILAARPSVGKTALALNMAINAATHKFSVGFFSLEMSKEQLMERMVSAVTEFDADSIRRGRLSDEQRDALVAKLTNVSETPLYIDDKPSVNWMDIRRAAKRMKRMYGIKLFFVDYLQLMSDVSDGEKRNREQQIARITRELKKLAKELRVPIIALSQLSRDLEKRGEQHKSPVLSDLRESGAIEQDADVVAFIYRPEYHGITANENGHSTLGETHIKIAKHRNGMLETVILKAHLNIQKFEDTTNFPTEEKLTESGSRGFEMWKPIGE